jgi:hypothetical protein
MDTPTNSKRVLNVGGNSKLIPLPEHFSGFEHLLLDIDPTGQPDIVCDARKLDTLDNCQFDAIYCSHNLEHYYRHDVPKVLKGFLHVLKESAFVHIRVPDVMAVMKTMLEKNLDIDDVLYQSALGPIHAYDVIYGYGEQIERSGVDFFAHKTGFSAKSLATAIYQAGFTMLYIGSANLEVTAYAFKGEPSQEDLQRLNLVSKTEACAAA